MEHTLEFKLLGPTQEQLLAQIEKAKKLVIFHENEVYLLEECLHKEHVWPRLKPEAREDWMLDFPLVPWNYESLLLRIKKVLPEVIEATREERAMPFLHGLNCLRAWMWLAGDWEEILPAFKGLTKLESLYAIADYYQLDVDGNL